MNSKEFRNSLSGDAYKALLNLAVTHELKTGNRLLWRRDLEALYQMASESLAHQSYTLKKHAVIFLKSLSSEHRELFKAQGIKLPKRKFSLISRIAKIANHQTNNAA